MIDIKKQREIVVYGTGLSSVKWAFEREENGGNIKYFLNSDSKIDTFCGKAVYSPDIRNVRNCYIVVVVSSVEIYMDVSRKLQQFGLREFDDYIYYQWINKKIVLIHGNCHLRIAKGYLESSETFIKQYAIYPNPEIHKNKRGKIDESVIRNCDVLIHQAIRPQNPFGQKLSAEYLRKDKKPNALEIVVPNLYGLGKAFFPHSSVNERNYLLKNGCDTGGMFPHADSVLDEGIRQGKTIEEIISFAKSEDAINKDVVLDNFNIYMEKIKERERDCDIKIYDYILAHYKYERLFYDMWHPTNLVIRKYAMEILQRLGITDENIYFKDNLGAHEVPIYPVIKECLGLEWKDANMREGIDGKKLRDTMSLEEYIYEYLWWCYSYRDKQ